MTNGGKDDPFLRVKEISRLTKRHRTTIYADIKRQLWPPMVRHGGASGMYESELRRMQDLIAGQPTREQVRALVRQLVRERDERARAVMDTLPGDLPKGK